MPCSRGSALVLALLLLMLAGCSDDDSCLNCPNPIAAGTDDSPVALDLRLLAPERAAMLTAGGSGLSPVLVRGEACDPARGIAGVVVNGQTVDIDPSGECSEFEVVVPSRWGLNLVDAELRDVAGDRVRRARSFLRSPDWMAGTDGPVAERRVPRAVLFHLRQELLDDGDRQIPADDLATILELILAGVDLAEGMDPVLFDDIRQTSYNCVGWTEYNHDGDRVTLTGPLTYSRIGIDQIMIGDGVLLMTANMYDLHMPIKVFHYGDQGCLGDWERTYYGVADVDRMELQTELVLSVSPAGDLVVTAQETVATPHGFSYEMDRFLDFMEGRVSDGIEAGLEDSGEAFQTVINDHVGSAMDIFRLPERVELPGVTLLLDRGWEDVRVVLGDGGAGFFQLTARVAVRPEIISPDHAGAPGSIEAGGDLPDLDAAPPSFAMALKEDLLNQMFWAVWVGGGLDFDDIGAASGVSQLTGLRISTRAQTPPVIMPGRDPGRVLLGIGDLYGELPLTQGVMDAALAARPDLAARSSCAVADTTAGIWFSMIQEGELSIDAATGKFVYTPTSAAEVAVEVTSFGNARCAAVLESYLRETISTSLPFVLQAIIAEFPAPRFETDLVEGGLSWGLDQFDLHRMGHYHCVEGTLTEAPTAGRTLR